MDSQKAQRTLRSAYSTLDVIIRRLQLALFVLCLLLHNEAVRSQSPLEEKGIRITHSIGQDAELTCQVTDLGKRKVIWSKLSDPYPIAIGSTRFTPSKKYRIDVPEESTSILTIKNLDPGDAGEYQCRLTGQVFVADSITLNIQTAKHYVGESRDLPMNEVKQSDEGNTYLLTTDTEISAPVGSTVLLPCHVENLQNNLVLWKNGRNDLLTLRKKVYYGDRRMSIIHNTRPEWSLEIKDIQDSDYGLYTCIINSEPVLTRTVLLKNPAPAPMAPVLLQDSHFQRRIEVTAGETVHMTCNFQANPPAKVTWYRRRYVDGKADLESLGKGNTYTLQSVSPEQSAHYICIGRNGLKPSGRGKTRLIVQPPPTTTTTRPTTFIPDGPIAPHLYHEEQRVGQYRGMNVVLNCTAIGQPRPTVHWTRYDSRLSNDHKYRIDTKTSGRHNFHSTLLIRSLTLRDYGEYECVGYNQLGLVTIPFEVYELQ